MEYKKLGEVANVTKLAGFEFTKHVKYTDDGEIIAIRALNLKDGRLVLDDVKRISKESSEKLPRSKLHKYDIVLSYTGTIGEIAQISKEGKYHLAPNVAKITPNRDAIDPEFLFQYMRSHAFKLQMVNYAHGSTQPTVPMATIRELIIPIYDLEAQKKIVRILSALDQKIELNNRQNETLFELGRQLYIEKFENDETVDKVELGNFFPVVTGKKDANASSENGKYPFFTCSKKISKIDDYAFDTSAILLAGNGDFNVKFYRGKFDAYQRTYVLIPNNPEYLGFLYWAISYNLPTITADYRGSVIKFITKGNIESFKVPFVDNKYIPAFMKYLERIEKNNQQNEILAGLRDALLPKLMSGEINLNEVTIK